MEEQEISYTYRTAAAIISRNKCHLVGVIATPKDDKKAYLDLYDGETASQPQVMRLRTDTGISNSVIFPDHIKMNRGIYVAMATDLRKYTVLWHTLPDE